MKNEVFFIYRFKLKQFFGAFYLFECAYVCISVYVFSCVHSRMFLRNFWFYLYFSEWNVCSVRIIFIHIRKKYFCCKCVTLFVSHASVFTAVAEMLLFRFIFDMNKHKHCDLYVFFFSFLSSVCSMAATAATLTVSLNNVMM